MNRSVAGAHFDFREPAAAGLPEDWRELDRAVWRWMRAHGADPLTARVAGWISQAEGQAHSALPLAWLAERDPPLADLDGVRGALQASALVQASAGDGAEPAPVPLVLDGDHAYLLRNHRAECAVAQALRQRRAAAQPPLQPLTEDDLRALFNGSWQDAEERQRAAVRQAIGRRLMVLTGGPGTGKTTTVLRMLLGLSREHRARTGRLPALQVAAPTGKAAQRLAEALRTGAARLRGGDHPLAADWQGLLDHVLAAPSGTVHRLLGSRGRHGGFAYRADAPLPADIVVVDEASMLDLALLRALLDALREDAVLVLVGDADQLTSVGTGSVMMDIVQALEADPRGDLVRLQHCFRADLGLVPIHEAVRSGDLPAFTAAFDHAATATDGLPAAAWHRVADRDALQRRLAAWARALQAALAACDITRPLPADAPELAAHLALLCRRQLLCALREGPFGAVQAAAAIAARLRRWDALAPWAGHHWYPGRSVIITRNDPAAGLYNGDVGLCVAVADAHGRASLQVAFDPLPTAPDAALPASPVRLFDPATLPPHEDAFALTVHKSQGSEYDHVAVLLPPDPESPLLTRQTLYTGLSRARTSLELWATRAATERAIATVLARHGRLAQRIPIPSRV